MAVRGVGIFVLPGGFIAIAACGTRPPFVIAVSEPCAEACLGDETFAALLLDSGMALPKQVLGASLFFRAFCFLAQYLRFSLQGLAFERFELIGRFLPAGRLGVPFLPWRRIAGRLAWLRFRFTLARWFAVHRRSAG